MIDFNIARLRERQLASERQFRSEVFGVYIPTAVTWNRLEGRPRSNDLTRPMRAEIRDPLWLLGRQWQMGEFEAQDAGTPIHARMSTQIAEPRLLTLPNGFSKPYDPTVPLEVTVERRTVEPDLMTALYLGRRWLDRLSAEFEEPTDISNSFLAAYGFAAPVRAIALAHALRERRERPPGGPLPALAADLDSLQLATQTRELALRRAIAGRSLDGGRLLADIANAKRDSVTPSDRFRERGILIPAGQQEDFIDRAAADLQEFWSKTFTEPAAAEDAWAPPHLEHNFTLRIPEGDERETALIADQYPGGHLDWYTFDSAESEPAADEERAPLPETTVKMFVPTPIRFAGTPNVRWWEFENAEVGFGITSAAKTDLIKMLLAEFGLVFSNDWFIVPLAAKIGSLIENKGIVVTDNFGFRTLVEPTARQHERLGLAGTWGMWTLTRRGVPGGMDARLFVAPAVAKALETRSLDEVLFLRDEMANLVWGVETVIPDALGGGRDGRAAAKLLREAITAAAPPPAFEDLGPEVLLRYTFMGTVPENWIPFISVTLAGEKTGSVFLQGAMPRFPPLNPALAGDGTPVLPHNLALPRGTLLARDPVANPNVVFEEEVLREGVMIRRTTQRTRSADGHTWTWTGRKKTAGRGEGSSGLAFDQAKPAKQGEDDLPVGGGDGGVPPEDEILSRVIVQLREDVEIPYADGAESLLIPLIGPAWADMLAAFPFLKLDRVFRDVDPGDLETLFDRTASEFGAPWPALQRFFVVTCPPGVDPKLVVAALRAFPQIFEHVYVESRPALPAINFADDPLSVVQFYLEPAPKGFDAKFAWTEPGGDGLNVTVADVEYDWELDHEDLASASIEWVTDKNAIRTWNYLHTEHGTGTLGLMVAADNTLGGVGLVPRAKVLLASAWGTDPNGVTVFNDANAINVASAKLTEGDVLLIELAALDNTPIETDLRCFAAIAAATARGITVIEPGGNGPGNGSLGRYFDLDTFVVPSRGFRALKRYHSDSGAVLVGACQADEMTPGSTARAPMAYSPRGERIDCFAYGEWVFTTSASYAELTIVLPDGSIRPNPFAGQRYNWKFAGTSSASALIAGVAASVQGLAKAILNRPLSPSELRRVLGDRTLNTPSANPATDRIGVMPNLRKITDFLRYVKARGLITGTWVTVRTGHELVFLGRNRVLDWVPSTRTWNVWPYDSLAISGDPLPSPAIESGTWNTIQSGHTLVYLGGDLVLDWVPSTGGYRLFAADWAKADFLPGPARTRGTWVTIRDQIVGDVLQQHRLVYLGSDHVLDWVPQDRSYRVWRLDRRGTRQDPLIGVLVAQPDGTVREQPLFQNVFPDPGMNANTQILAISSNEVLIWHGDTGAWRVWFYDRIGLSPQPFTESPRGGTWTTIRGGHVLLWLTDGRNGRLLDWEPATGRYRLFPDIPKTGEA